MNKITLNITRKKARRIILDYIIYNVSSMPDYDLGEMVDIAMRGSQYNARITHDDVNNDNDKV